MKRQKKFGMKFCNVSICLAFMFLVNMTKAQEPINYVNPFIGSSNFGTTNPGAIVPNGMVSVVPFNVTGSHTNTWDKDARWWSTPYSSDNNFLTGFSHVNLSGVGCPDLGVILVMPTVGEVNANLKEYGSHISNQKAEPGYYSCFLDKYKIQAEVSSTPRTGISRFTFPAGQSNVLIDLGNGLTNESGASLRLVSDTEVEGSRMTGTFCYEGNSERPVYFVARFSKPARSFGAWKKMPALKAEKKWSDTGGKFKYYEGFKQHIAGDSVGAYFTFDTKENEQILVAVGISYVSIENARLNLNTEQDRINFNETLIAAQNEWQDALSKIKVEGGTEEQKTIFYTALYHTQIHPNIFNDVNGQYPEMETNKIGESTDYNRYTVFSLWDTYRNFHQLMSLLYPDKQLDMVRSMIDMYKESGWLPKWELNSKETYTMNGDPALPVIADTYLRGLTDFDIQTAYSAMYKHATTPQKNNKLRPDFDFYVEHGYMPLLKEFDRSVSVALEYYIADWNLGQLAKKLGKTDHYKRFNKQSLKYVNYFDKKEYKMLRPKLADGTFLKTFNPLQGKDFEAVPGFHEGTAWQYTFGVPHDIPGLTKLMGGEKKFVESLQMVFDSSLFDMANEPDIHYPFLFNYIKGEEWRAQKETNRLLEEYFKNAPDGLPGNDDCGTMSAWAVFSMIGLYPVCPGDMNYAITEPVFDKITIQLDQNYYPGKELIIKKSGNDDDTSYIKKISKDGTPTESFFIKHKDLVNGGVLRVIK